MNQRSKEILQLLIERKQIPLMDIAEIYEVSERTIRNDIVSLNDYLTNVGYGTVAIKQKQITLQLVVDKQVLLTDINQFDAYEYKFTSDERSLICLLILLNSQTYVTIQQLSEKLLASRSTIVNDIRTMRKLALEHQIQVISRANKGFLVEAKEESIRDFLYQVMELEHFHLLETVAFSENYQQSAWFQELSSLIHLLRHHLKSSEKEFAKLVRYMTLSTYRNTQGYYLADSSSKTTSSLYEELRFLLKDYSYLTAADLVFISERLENMSSGKQIKKGINKESIRIQVGAMRFIEKISQELNIDFKEDYIFYDHFSAHLLRMLREEESYVKRPFFMDDVIKSNARIEQAIRQHIGIIEEQIGRPARAIEVDYIIIHVYAAMERKKRKGSHLRVALLTKEKATEIFFIESKLNNHFSFNLDIYSVDDRVQGKYDLILTTTDLPNQDYVRISPFVSDEDYIVIANKIDQLTKEKNAGKLVLERDTALRLYEVLLTELEKTSGASRFVQSTIRKTLLGCVEDVKEEDKMLRLADFLPVDRIQLDVEASDWRESIYKAGEVLVSDGDIDPSYLEVIIDNIEENGAYMVISKGFIFPHAQIGDYNKRASMNLVRLKEALYFDDDVRDDPIDIGTQPVRYVCLLSAINSKEHSKAFFNLSNLLKHPDFIKDLDACQSPEEMHRVIDQAESLLEIGR